MKEYRVIVTGDRDDWAWEPTGEPGSAKIQFHSLPVLRYERLPISPDLVERWMSQKPVEWIVYTSPRAVRFWSETLLEGGYELPAETRVACLGERTAEIAAGDGYSVDFCPREPGTDGFLEEFVRVGSPTSILIPAAEGGRPKIKERLRQLGYEVAWVPLYRTLAREAFDASLPQDLASADAIVFTSPSSVDALLDQVTLPDRLQVLAIGGFTGRHLESKGFVRPALLPDGDFSRIGEVLC